MTISTYKILIADDKAMTRDIIASVLSSKRHSCKIAVDSAQALEKISAEMIAGMQNYAILKIDSLKK